MFIDIYNKFSCKFIKFINKYKKTVCKYLNWLEFQIPAFRAFCKTAFARLYTKCASTKVLLMFFASSRLNA